jgi:hypothetical protein
MTYDSTSPPVRVIDIVSRKPEPAPALPAAAPRPRRNDVPVDGPRRAPRRWIVSRGRKGER